MPDRRTMRDRARAMRKAPTEAERAMWRLLRLERLGVKFRRQAWLGDYIADFVCFSPRLVVEVDGSQHAGSDYDATRDAAFQAHGYKVLRFWNGEVLRNPDGVCRTILAAMGRNELVGDAPRSPAQEPAALPRLRCAGPSYPSRG